MSGGFPVQIPYHHCFALSLQAVPLNGPRNQGRTGFQWNAKPRENVSVCPCFLNIMQLSMYVYNL
jgi:hypothetical protein